MSPFPSREIPENIIPKVAQIEGQGLLALYRSDYRNAERLFREEYDLLFNEQRTIGRPIHKGAPLYNRGLALLGRERAADALLSFTLAYVEDTLNMEPGNEENADRSMSASILRDSFVIDLRLLRDIKLASGKLKVSDSFEAIYDPEGVLKLALPRAEPEGLLRLSQRPALRLGGTPIGFPQPRDRRVFIGTNYDSFAHVIPDIRIAVSRKNYQPVILAEASFPAKQTHDISLLLLHTCAYAIFEITDPRGQLMEIERARDYGVKVLLLRSRPHGHTPKVSQMIRSLKLKMELYADMWDLAARVSSFLP